MFTRRFQTMPTVSVFSLILSVPKAGSLLKNAVKYLDFECIYGYLHNWRPLLHPLLPFLPSALFSVYNTDMVCGLWTLFIGGAYVSESGLQALCFVFEALTMATLECAEEKSAAQLPVYLNWGDHWCSAVRIKNDGKLHFYKTLSLWSLWLTKGHDLQ